MTSSRTFRPVRVWVWEAAIYARVKNKDAAAVQAILDRKGAEIKEGISQIIGRAQLAQLKEPDRQTLNRQFSTFLDKLLAGDSGADPLIERVLIPKCRGFPARVLADSPSASLPAPPLIPRVPRQDCASAQKLRPPSACDR
jgi:hypothetical protein